MIENNAELNVICRDNDISRLFLCCPGFSLQQDTDAESSSYFAWQGGNPACSEGGRATAKLQAVLTHLYLLLLLSLHLAHVSQTTCRCNEFSL